MTKERRPKRKRQSKSELSTESAAVPPSSNNTPPCWLSLTSDVLATCFSYCNVEELFALGRTCSAFRQAWKLAISRAESLHFSVLRLIMNKKKNARYSDVLVARMLEHAGESLQRLELLGLRHLRGGAWLERLLEHCPNLTSLDVSGCTCLQIPSTLFNAVNLQHIHLNGCKRMDTRLFAQVGSGGHDALQTLSLGGCSQRITDTSLQIIVSQFPHLRTLDLSGLQRIENSGDLLSHLPKTLECLFLEGCERVRFPILERIAEQLERNLFDDRLDSLIQEVTCPQTTSMEELWAFLYPFLNNEVRLEVDEIRAQSKQSVLKTGWPNLRVVDVSNCGTASTGVTTGLIGLLACLSRGSLRQVNISGCETVSDMDLSVLAATCTSLTSLEARACPEISDDSIQALAKYSKHLAVLDVSASFNVTPYGIGKLCPRGGVYWCVDDEHQFPATFSDQQRGCPALRVLKLGSLADMDDDTLLAMGGMVYAVQNDKLYRSSSAGFQKLMLLNIRDCDFISPEALEKTIRNCPLLIEVDARGIKGRLSREGLPSRLRFLDGRRIVKEEASAPTDRLCTVTQHSQRTKASQGIKLQPMFHCIDCKLLPSEYRGMCSTCADVCHKGHRTYFGSMERFYCDCAFGIVPGGQCKALK